LTGCWSSKDIEKLDLLIGVGVDAAQEGSITSGNHNDSSLTVTYQMAKINGMQSQQSNKETARPYLNVEETGSSILETARDILLERKNTMNGQHQRLVIIGSEVAKNRNIREILDFFIREQEARMSVLVMVTEGSAKELLEYMETDDIPSMHIYEITENIEKSNKLIEPTSLAKVNALLEAKSSFLLQNVVKMNNEIKLSGAAVIKGSTLTQIGFLGEEDLVGLNWLTAASDGGIVKVSEENSDKPVIYELESINSKVTPKIKSGHLSFQVKVELNGLIIEVAKETDDLAKQENRTKLEKLIQEKVKREIQHSLEKIQQELQVDVIGFHDYVRIEYPKFWSKNKNDWDNLFSQSTIDYEVEVNISDYGMNFRE
jgi:spore germination protein